jgi:hypothetical protein
MYLAIYQLRERLHKQHTVLFKSWVCNTMINDKMTTRTYCSSCIATATAGHPMSRFLIFAKGTSCTRDSLQAGLHVEVPEAFGITGRYARATYVTKWRTVSCQSTVSVTRKTVHAIYHLSVTRKTASDGLIWKTHIVLEFYASSPTQSKAKICVRRHASSFRSSVILASL